MKKSTLSIRIATLIMFGLLSQQLNAQTDTITGKDNANKIGGFRMSAGFSYQVLPGSDLSLLNRHLESNGLATVSNQYGAFNVDLIHFIYKSNVFNLGLGGPITKNTVNDSSKTALTGFTFNIALGRVIYHTRKILLYPMVGVNFDELDIDAYFAGFKSAKDVSGTIDYSSINLSLNLDYFTGKIGHNIDWKYANSFPFSCIVSFTVGYLYCPTTSYWNDNNFDITNRYTPNVNYPVNVIGSLTYSNLSMFYASIKFGFGIHHTCEKI
ncbi:MAG: hypothetical protein ACLQQ4_12880 [Bacteroidia bacterium]